MTRWNQPSPTFAYTMNLRKDCDLALSLETPYFGTQNNKTTPEMLLLLGKSFAKAIKNYIEVTKENYEL